MIKDQFDLTDKVAMVIGGRGFLGRRFCAALSESGARVYSADLEEASLAAQKDHSTVFPASGIKEKTIDVNDIASVRELVESVVDETSRIDILVYSVTVKSKDSFLPFTEATLEGWQQVLQAELNGLFLVTQQVGRIMESIGHGSIIFMSSIYGMVGNDQRIYEGSNLAELYTDNSKKPKRIYSPAVYAAAKGAVISLTRYLAAYWGETGIRVNCISPGGLGHPGENEEFVKKYSDRTPLGRKAGLDEISGGIVYLASDASSYVTGHNLVIDGGWTIW